MELTKEQQNELNYDTQELLKAEFLDAGSLALNNRGYAHLARVLLQDKKLKEKLIELAKEVNGAPEKESEEEVPF